jgi:hypothetical protein
MAVGLLGLPWGLFKALYKPAVRYLVGNAGKVVRTNVGVLRIQKGLSHIANECQ